MRLKKLNYIGKIVSTTSLPEKTTVAIIKDIENLLYYLESSQKRVISSVWVVYRLRTALGKNNN